MQHNVPEFFTSAKDFSGKLANLPAFDVAGAQAARARQNALTKPQGSLGRLEDIACFLAGWQGRAQPELTAPHMVVFAGNHGVACHDISPYPPEVTAQMVANFAQGGAAINALCTVTGLTLHVVPLDLDRPTGDITGAAAMSEKDCLAALNAGAAAVPKLCDLLCVGEMGIGNTTISATLAAASFGGAGATWVGRGTGSDAVGIARKIAAVDKALAYHKGQTTCAFSRLKRVGGRELAAIAGAVVAARTRRIPVLLDGFVTAAAVAPLFADNKEALTHCLAGHMSAEQGHKYLLEHMNMKPLLQLGMCLGEGSGAALAFGLVKAAVATHEKMASFEDAGVAKIGCKPRP